MVEVIFSSNVSESYKEAYQYTYEHSSTFRDIIDSHEVVRFSASNIYSPGTGSPAISKPIIDPERTKGIEVKVVGHAVNINPKSGALIDGKPASLVELISHEVAHSSKDVAETTISAKGLASPLVNEAAVIRIENEIRADLHLNPRTDIDVEGKNKAGSAITYVDYFEQLCTTGDPFGLETRIPTESPMLPGSLGSNIVWEMYGAYRRGVEGPRAPGKSDDWFQLGGSDRTPSTTHESWADKHGGGAGDSGSVGGTTPTQTTTTRVDKNDDGYTRTSTTTRYESGVSQTTTKQTVSTPSGPKEVTKTTTKAAPAPKDDPKKTGPQPILLDLDGDGVQITEFGKSSQFTPGADGLQHRSSWAGAGNGVLFFDPDGRNAITEQRQYVFTEWNPTASGDLEALRSVWDTNGDGKLTAADTEFAKFKVLVTNADGSTTVMTLAQLGVTAINLTANAVNIGMAEMQLAA
jgi:hypothetical protein